MYVCLCMAITDRDANEAIASGARSAGQILRACGSGRPCGGCTPTLRKLLRAAGEPDDAGVISITRYREAR